MPHLFLPAENWLSLRTSRRLPSLASRLHTFRRGFVGRSSRLRCMLFLFFEGVGRWLLVAGLSFLRGIQDLKIGNHQVLNTPHNYEQLLAARWAHR